MIEQIPGGCGGPIHLGEGGGMEGVIASHQLIIPSEMGARDTKKRERERKRDQFEAAMAEQMQQS